MKHLDKKIEINDQFAQAFNMIEDQNLNVFLTGKAGTGKSTFLDFFRSKTRKNIAVLASTGVAALNVRGQTIHSFFRFRPDITPESVKDIRLSKNKLELLKKIQTIIIDEISMVRADLLDCVDEALRTFGPSSKEPFGGVQMIFIGDLFQLPPVVTQQERGIFQTLYKSPYFFDAKVFKELTMDFIELEKNYRQKDETFLTILNAVRNNILTQHDLNILNTRFLKNHTIDPKDFYVYLTTTNDLADKLNYEKIHQIEEKLFTFEGEFSGKFEIKMLPTHQTLELKVGAQVMILTNAKDQAWVNGSIGKIIAINENLQTGTIIRVELTTGDRVDITPFIWEIYNFFFNEESGKIESEVIGSFRQFPLKLAWAVTIHKSQGKTFEKVVIDFGRGTFCHGHTYVALSRATTLEGIILKRPISTRDIILDNRVPNFLIEYQYSQAKRKWPEDKKKEVIEDAISNRRTIDIIYLKEKGERNRRTIVPKIILAIEHAGQKCFGVEAFCTERQKDWIFRLPCIIDIQFKEITNDQETNSQSPRDNELIDRHSERSEESQSFLLG